MDGRKVWFCNCHELKNNKCWYFDFWVEFHELYKVRPNKNNGGWGRFSFWMDRIKKKNIKDDDEFWYQYWYLVWFFLFSTKLRNHTSRLFNNLSMNFMKAIQSSKPPKGTLSLDLNFTLPTVTVNKTSDEKWQ